MSSKNFNTESKLLTRATFRKMNSIMKSMTLSMITVPNNLSIGTLSVELRAVQRAISPDLGITVFAK